jgi:hypothetical protein
VRSTLLVIGALLALALAACGGDDEGGSTTAATPTDTVTEALTETETVETVETETVESTPTETTPPSTSPEDQPGGAGDEEPARTLAMLTGENGKITPRVVRVPSFIAVRVELRSADGQAYGLDFAGKRLQTNNQISSVSTQFAGLRPQEKLIGVPLGGNGNGVVIVASAEPGP